MIVSDRFTKQLMRHEGKVTEGVRHVLYRCPKGKLTIGYGHNIEDNGISDYIARVLLREDILTSGSELRQAFPWFDSIGEIRQGVLVNMHFNMGLGKLRTFKKMIVALEKADFATAAAEMLDSKWHIKDVGARAVELANQMEKGEW